MLGSWATSSVSQLINASWGEAYEKNNLIPMSTRTQAREIIRTWAFYTLVKSYYHTKQVPWKNLMIRRVFDKKEKMQTKHKLKSQNILIGEFILYTLGNGTTAINETFGRKLGCKT